MSFVGDQTQVSWEGGGGGGWTVKYGGLSYTLYSLLFPVYLNIRGTDDLHA